MCVKLGPYFSSLGSLVTSLESQGAKGVALFNRFYQPNIDLETLTISDALELSTSGDALLAMRWIAIPRDFEMPKTGTEFDPVLTRALSDLGAKMGADPTSWLGEDELGIVELERAVLDAEEQP